MRPGPRCLLSAALARPMLHHALFVGLVALIAQIPNATKKWHPPTTPINFGRRGSDHPISSPPTLRMPSRKNSACWINLLNEENEPSQVMRYAGASSPRVALAAAAYADDEQDIPVPEDDFDAPRLVILSPKCGLGKDTTTRGYGTSSATNVSGVSASAPVDLTDAMRQVTLRPEHFLGGKDDRPTADQERERQTESVDEMTVLPRRSERQCTIQDTPQLSCEIAISGAERHHRSAAVEAAQRIRRTWSWTTTTTPSDRASKGRHSHANN